MGQGQLTDFSAAVDELKKRISSETSASGREWEKVAHLVTCGGYLDFLGHLTGADPKQVAEVLQAFPADDRFRAVFSRRIQEFEASSGFVHGDVRLHSLTLYAVVRLVRPETVVETGVASGKSSALILLALDHNAHGSLTSIDLPNRPGDVLPDGALTHTGGRDVGWLVPEYLRERWDLRLGDTRSLLPAAIDAVGPVDVFFHDSLHTRDHVLFELNTVATALRPPAVVLVDNVDVADGALDAFVAAHDLHGATFGDFGGVRVPIGLDGTSAPR